MCVALVLAGVSAAVVAFLIARGLIAPKPCVVGPPPRDLPAQSVRIDVDGERHLAGWLSETNDARAAVLLLHGVRANRLAMLDRARWLARQRFQVLLVDFQAHGESPGEHITMGQLEAEDAAAGVRELRRRYADLPVAVIGSSLGGAAALLADYDVAPPDAMVLEAVFADLETAAANRLERKFGQLGRVLTPLLMKPFEWYFGMDADDISPAVAAGAHAAPMLIVQGAEDERARPSEARMIHAHAGGPKELWIIDGAAHVDLHRFAGEAYERRVLDFLGRHLDGTAIDTLDINSDR